MLKEVIVGKQYRNIKNQKLYRVMGIGLHTELGTMHVRYEPLYDSDYPEYYRPLDEPKVGFKVKFEEALEFGEKCLSCKFFDTTYDWCSEHDTQIDQETPKCEKWRYAL